MGAAIGGAAGQAGGSMISGLINAYSQQKLQKEQAGINRDMMYEQFELMQKMFPFSEQATNFAMDLYGDGGFSEIENYLTNPTKPSNLERQLFEFFGGTTPSKGRGKTQKHLFDKYGAADSGPMAGKGVPMLEELTGLLKSLVPYAEQWGETGFKTDIKPIQDYAMRMFEREMMPEVAERFGGNIAGSGFNREMGRTMGDVTSELGAMEVALQEAAAGRRMQGLSGPIQSIFQDPMMANAQFATAGAQAGQMYRNAVDNARPGKGLLAALPMFAQVDQGQGFMQQGYPTSGTDFGNMMGALGGAGAQLGGSIAELLKNWPQNESVTKVDWVAPGGSWDQGPIESTGGGGDVSSVMDTNSFSFA